jgi:hypothetical protein
MVLHDNQTRAMFQTDHPFLILSIGSRKKGNRNFPTLPWMAISA